jgi:hypothetical protein
MDDLPIDAFLAGYPPPIAELAERLRSIVLDSVPESTERIRIGWRLIGFDVPHGRRSTYFAFVAPEPKHVHIGFERGILLDDPTSVLKGAGITKQVRWFTFRPGDQLDEALIAEFVREAAEIARLDRGEREARLADRRLRAEAGAGL